MAKKLDKKEAESRKPKAGSNASYTAKDIQVLEGLEPVRKRPGMYIGSTGPDGLHHLIHEVADNSVTYQTPITLKENGMVKLVKIGELVDSYFDKNKNSAEKSKSGDCEILRKGFNISSLSFNKIDLNLSYAPISSLIRHKVNSDIFRITLQNNRQVEITPYHSLFTLKKGEVVPLKGSEIVVGTPLIVPKIWSEVDQPVKNLDLIDEFLRLDSGKTAKTNLYGLTELLRGDTELATKIKSQIPQWTRSRPPANIWSDYMHYDYLPFNLIRFILPSDLAKIKSAYPKIGNKNNARFRIPYLLPINREIVELLGLFAAEGSVTVSDKKSGACRITFSFGAHERELIDYTKNLIFSVFDCEFEERYVHKTARVIVMNSSTLALIFRDIIGTGFNSGSKRVPNVIFNVDSELRTRFLIGYMSGDGYPTKNWISHLIAGTTPLEEERMKFSAVSKSRDLIVGLSYLLSTLNKTYSYGERKKQLGRRFISIEYKGKIKQRELHSRELSYALDFYWNTHSSYINYLPVKEIIEKIHYYHPRSFSVSASGIDNGKAMCLFDEGRLDINLSALKFMASDLGILRVRKIEKIHYDHPWVYDISVPDGENFVGGFAPVCLHNSIDEAMIGHAKNIEISLLPNNRVRVKDDGRGIPVEKHKQTGKSTLETVLTVLHAGGKFGSGAYKVSGGLHGVGVSVVNALSIYLRAEVHRDGSVYEQEYSRGEPKKAVKKIGSAKDTGTIIEFEPDPEIFKEISFDLDRIVNHFRQQAYLTKGVRIQVADRRVPIVVDSKKGKYEAFPEYTFYFEGGIVSYIEFLNRDLEPKNKNIFYIGKEQQEIFVEVALQYVDDLQSREISFANNIHTHEGGMHVTGFRSAITRALNDYARKNGVLKEKDDNLSGEDVREGLTTIISVKLKDPQFEGQTKAKLGTPDARTAVETVMGTEFSDWLERNPTDAREILETVILASKARLAAKAARETVLRKGAMEGMTLPGKLADCSSRDATESELFLVEGDSAGGCWDGNTLVALADGRNLSFIELTEEYKNGKNNFCYTIRKDGHVGIAPIINPRITKKNAEVIKIILDNDEELFCTPDHKFMLRNGAYKEAKDLTPLDSLMPLYRKISKIGGRITINGYEMVFSPSEHYWRFTHVLADQYNLDNGAYSQNDGDTRHHKDFNKLNNNPDNLVRMNKQDHLLYHTKHLFKTAFRPDVLEKLRKIQQSKEYREKISQTMRTPQMRAMLSARAKKQWEDEGYKKFMTSKFLEFYHSNADYRKRNNETLNKLQKQHWSNPENRIDQAQRTKLYYENHPEDVERRSVEAKEQWQDLLLRKWRCEKTKEQWTPLFRTKRKKAYDQTYLDHSLKLLRRIWEQDGSFDRYDKERIATKNKNALSLHTFTERFFDGNSENIHEAVQNYNHKIVKIEKLANKVDVYDIEVPETHNFALASGVFVHNSSKQGRDRRTQAILPLKGKILNVEKARVDKMLAHQEIRALIIAMGTAIAEEFDLSKLRYHKIVLLVDSDIDGSHIRTLLLTLFYRYFPKIIENGHLYIAQPPLYRIQKGSKHWYIQNDAEKDKLLAELKKESGVKTKDKKTKDEEWEVTPLKENGKTEKEPSFVEATVGEEKISGVTIQRYKGLGEMNPIQLWETTLDPVARTLLQVTIKDAHEADRVFDMLMGSDVMPRKKFIQSHAKSVQNLDI